MIIKELEVNNFLSFGPNVKLDLEHRGITFIRGENRDTGGSNGSGKSSIIDALIWGLFGETIRGVSGDDVVNKYIGRDCSVKVTTNYNVVTRTRKHGKLKNSLTHFNVLTGSDISRADMRKTQIDINNLLNTDYQTFINSIVLSSSNYRANFLDPKNSSTRRAIIETILGINRYADYHQLAKERTKDFDVKKSIKLSDVNSAKASIESYHKKTAEFAEKRASFESLRQEKIDAINAELEKLRSIDVERDMDAYKQIADARTLIHAIDKKLNEVKWGSEAEKRELKKLFEECDKYISLGVKACHYCGSILDQSRVQDLIEPIKEKANAIKARYDAAIEHMTNLEQKRDIVAEQIGKLLPKTPEHTLIEIGTKVKLYDQRICELENEVNPYHEVGFDDEIAELNVLIDKLSAEVDAIAAEADYYSFWEVGFGNKGLKTYILKDMIPFFNKQIQFYLDILSKGKISLEFDEYLDVVISGLSYSNCSSGERKRVDLAVLIALFELSCLRQKVMPNIIILDEVLDGLDAIGFESVIDLLSELNRKIPTILVISHNNDLTKYFDKSITAVKESNISYIQE